MEMITHDHEFSLDNLVRVAQLMAAAARTAPKARGIDQLEIALLTENELGALADRVAEIGSRLENKTFLRDSRSLRAADCLLLIGTKTDQMGLKYCGLCGYPDCAALAAGPGGVCVFAANDLGIATGSAVALAADLRIDTRVMYTAGMAALEQGIFSPEVKIAWGLPLAASGKNPFFDRG